MLEQTWQRANRPLDDDQKMPERDQTCPKVIPNGCQEMPKTSQMATKVDQKWSQIGVESSQTELESTSFDFFEILGPFGEPFGNHFGNVQNVSKIDARSMPKCIRKSMSNEVGKMVDGQADRDPPGPAHLKSNHGQNPSIQQSM